MQTRTLFFPASIALVFLLAGCNSTPPPKTPNTRAEAKAVRDTEAAWTRAINTRDIEKATAYYAEDASVLLPGKPVVTGKASIQRLLKPYLDDKNFAQSCTTDMAEVAKSGDMAYTQGTCSMTTTNPKTQKTVTEKNKYVGVYMKQSDGSWKCVADISNADGAAVQAKAPAAEAKTKAPAKRTAHRRR
jgi:uncharacterized protein (TIGR02246 family)